MLGRNDDGSSLALWTPEGTRLPVMQLPENKPEYRTEWKRRGQKNPRFGDTDQRHQTYAKRHEKADRVTGKASRAVLSKWNNILRMQFVRARRGRSNKCACVSTERSHCRHLLIRDYTP